MLKSTYKPSANLAAQAPLPPGWTEHKAPTGHTYYYNVETKESTYKRPGAPPPPPGPSLAGPQQPLPPVRLSDPRAANAFMAQFNAPPANSFHSRGGFGGGRGGRGGGDSRPRPQPIDKPRSKAAIPGCEPWLLVYTKYGRRFAYNPVKRTSFWRIPDKLKAGILELDQARIRDKAGLGGAGKEDEGKAKPEAEATKKNEDGDEDEDQEAAAAVAAEQQDGFDSDEYEEVEVTDDDDEAGDREDVDGHTSKRLRMDDTDQPVEFSEADIAFQLQAMGVEYDVDDQGGYDEGEGEEEGDWGEEGDDDDGGGGGGGGMELSDEDAESLFRDLLNDFGINPYSPWEKLLEEGKIMDDARYTALTTTRARKEVWEAWSRDKIRELKEQRAKQEKQDPRIPYLALLQQHATPKLYWPEFKRKYKKEPAMRDAGLADKDREKWYREYINRLKLPGSTQKADLAALLKAVPITKLHGQTHPSHLPPEILTDMRFAALDAKIRDPLVEAYIQTLPPPPEDLAAAEEDEAAARKARDERRRREKALREREHAVAEEKRRQQRRLEHGRAMLREEERELAMAMKVGKKGLQSQLVGAPREDKDAKPGGDPAAASSTGGGEPA